MLFVSRFCFISVLWLFYITLYLINLTTSQVIKHGSNIKSSDSCETSPIEQNVTLRGGLKAGYFHKLAQYVAMELCVQLCCEEKGCDVAFMIGNNCYGVKCFSEVLCSIIPAHNAPKTLMMSKVDFRGEVYLQTFMPAKLKCYKKSIEQNVTLKDGLSSGNFTAVGHVDSIDACARLCCVSDHCDLAFLINDNCFIVKCHGREQCRTVALENSKFHTYVARVHRTREIVNDHETVQALSSIHGKQSKLMCKNGVIQYNHTLLGGYNAGHFKMLCDSTNMTTCIRLCCAERTCDVAFMIEAKCYGVSCRNLNQCRAIPAKHSSTLSHLAPRLSYITSRNEEVSSVIQRNQHENCKATIISYDVTLRGGKHAGEYKTYGDVSSIQKCIHICCMEEDCDVAFMISGNCFTVRCHNDEGCEEVHAPGTGFKPMISHVTREKTTPKPRGKHPIHKISDHRNKTVSQDVPHIPSPNLPSLDSAHHHCTNSEIMYNVTLQGGIKAGKYKDRGVLSNMEECLRVCCIATSCDLAFMLGDHCFSVTCRNQSLCEVVGARSSHLNPRVAYIYARSDRKDLKNKEMDDRWRRRRKNKLKVHKKMRKQKKHRKNEITILEKLYGKDSLMLQNYFTEKLRKELRNNKTLSNATLKIPSIILQDVYQNHTDSSLNLYKQTESVIVGKEPTMAGVNISELVNKTLLRNNNNNSSPNNTMNISNDSKAFSNETTVVVSLQNIGASLVSKTNLSFDGYTNLTRVFKKGRNTTQTKSEPLYDYYNKTNIVTSLSSQLENGLTAQEIKENDFNPVLIKKLDQESVSNITHHKTGLNYNHVPITTQDNKAIQVPTMDKTSERRNTTKYEIETTKNRMGNFWMNNKNFTTSGNKKSLISNRTKLSNSLKDVGLLKSNKDHGPSRNKLKTPLYNDIYSSSKKSKTTEETINKNETDSLLEDAFTFQNSDYSSHTNTTEVDPR